MIYTNLLRWTILGLLSAILLVPFIIADGSLLPNMFFPFITGKNFVFRILVELALGAYILLALREPQYRPRMSHVMWALVGLVGWMALATLASVDPVKSFWSNFERMEGYVGLLHMFAFCLVAGAVLNTKEWWGRFFNVSIGLSAFQGIFALMQVTGAFGLSPSSQSGARADGTLGNATYLAVYMLFNAFLTLYMLAGERKRHISIQALYGLAFVLQFAGLYYTSTRGALLGFVGGLIVAAVCVAWRSQGELMQGVRRTAVISLTAIVLIVGGFIALRETPLIQNSPTLSRLASISLQDGTTRARIFNIWPMALQGVAEKPLLGWGQENFNFVFNKYYTPEMYSQEQWFDRAHNAFLDWMIAGGIPAFLLYIALLLSSVFLIARSELSVLEQAAMLGVLGAYAFNNLFVFDNLISSMYFFLLLAFAHNLAPRRPHRHLFLTRPASSHAVAIAAPLVLVGTILCIWVVNVPGLARAQGLLTSILTVSPVQTPTGIQGVPKELKDNLTQFQTTLAGRWPGTGLGRQETVEQLIQFASNNVAGSSSVNPDLAQQFFTTSKEAIDALIADRKNDARLELFGGTLLASFNKREEAQKYFTAAMEHSPRKQQILFQVAISYIQMGKTAEALVPLKLAFDEAPEYRDARILYAAGLFYAGQGAAADKILQDGFGTVLVDDARMLQVYADTKQLNRVLGIWLERGKVSPDNAQVHIGIASAYFAMGKNAETIAELNIALRLDPTLAPQIQSTITQIQNGTLKP